MLVDETEPPIEEALNHDKTGSESEGFMLLVLCVLIFDVGNFFIHDSVDQKAEVDTDNTD